MWVNKWNARAQTIFNQFTCFCVLQPNVGFSIFLSSHRNTCVLFCVLIVVGLAGFYPNIVFFSVIVVGNRFTLEACNFLIRRYGGVNVCKFVRWFGRSLRSISMTNGNPGCLLKNRPIDHFKLNSVGIVSPCQTWWNSCFKIDLLILYPWRKHMHL